MNDKLDDLANGPIPNCYRELTGSRHERAYEDDVWDQTMAFLHHYLDQPALAIPDPCL